MRCSSVQNLIFDLGGVIIDLSLDRTFQAFADLAGLKKNEVERLIHELPEFPLYEKGSLTDRDFRDFIRETLTINSTDKEIDEAWNAMLLGIAHQKLKLLLQLKEHYRIFLLSNTNAIHLQYINERMMPLLTGEKSLDPYFHRSYYSHLVQKRKPEAEIFRQVIDENKLVPENTLFLDDNVMNVRGAEAIGLQALHVTSSDFILTYFHG